MEPWSIPSSCEGLMPMKNRGRRRARCPGVGGWEGESPWTLVRRNLVSGGGSVLRSDLPRTWGFCQSQGSKGGRQIHTWKAEKKERALKKTPGGGWKGPGGRAMSPCAPVPRQVFLPECDLASPQGRVLTDQARLPRTGEPSSSCPSAQHSDSSSHVGAMTI